jgi:hypothetical protein
MHDGFTCGNGWFPLLHSLSKKLEALIMKLPENKRRFYRATQVKQKFGSLNFYMYDRTPEMRVLIDKAIKKSSKTCEVCGRSGSLIQIPGRWVTTSCVKHEKITAWQEMEKIDIHWTAKLLSLFEVFL